MKKVVAFILILLPVFLMVFISLAGQIFSEYQYIPVEGVLFTDHQGETLPLSATIKVGKEGTMQVYPKVLPERATNKNVTYIVRDANIAEITVDGVLTGLQYGTTKLTIITESGSFTSSINITVTDEAVISVKVGLLETSGFVGIDKYTMHIGEEFTFAAEINATTALNKAVIWNSSNPSVATVIGGTVIAIKEGTSTITIVSKDGGKTDSFVLTVDNQQPTFVVKKKDVVIMSDTIDLLECIIFDESLLSAADISFFVVGGAKFASVEGSVLTVTKTSEIITVEAKAVIGNAGHTLTLYIVRV